jgi:hypothetical protein
MIKLLWIDDDFDRDLVEKRMALRMNDDMESHFANNATDAYFLLLENHFDVVIFDMLLPAGPDDLWDKYRVNGFEKYGYALLHEISSNKFQNQIFAHLEYAKFGIFTNDSDDMHPGLFADPIAIKRSNFKMKTNAYHENEFVAFIEQVFSS